MRQKGENSQRGAKSSLEPGRAGGAGGWRGPRRVGRVGGERRARRSGEGCPMGSPTGRQTRWGKAGAPQRRGVPGVKRRVSTSQAEAAPAVTVGRHEVSGGRARRNGGSARLGRGAAAMGAKMPLLTSQAGHGDHCGKESSRRNIFLRNNREETRQATSAMGKASQTSSSTPVSEKRYATGMRMIS